MSDFIFHDLQLPAYHRPVDITDDYKRGMCNALSILQFLKTKESMHVTILFTEGRVTIECELYDKELRGVP